MFETFQGVMVLLAFLVPGYVCRATEARISFVQKRLPWEELAMAYLTRTTILFLPIAPWLYKVYDEKLYDVHPLQAVAVGVLVLFIIPVLVGLILGIAHRNNLINNSLAHLGIPPLERRQEPTAWDAVFGNLDECFVVVTLKTGRIVKGFAGNRSHFSVDPENRDIYLSHVVESDKNIYTPGTKGIYINANDIESIELISKQG